MFIFSLFLYTSNCTGAEIKKKEMKKEETKITILVNDLSENMLANLRKIAKEYKMVNIVTNHREKFKKIE